MRIRYTAAFKRGYKIWKKNNPGKDQLLAKAVNLFIEDHAHPLLHIHKLKGRFHECSAFSITYDLRIMFYQEDAEHTAFIAIGTHDKVY